jgi:hypothetical protein
MNNQIPKQPRILLTSASGPYGQDDEYGSRAINPMELYHNQATRSQGPFSLCMFHRSWGLMLIQVNISAPSALLDLPVMARFIEEISSHVYDIVGRRLTEGWTYEPPTFYERVVQSVRTDGATG